MSAATSSTLVLSTLPVSICEDLSCQGNKAHKKPLGQIHSSRAVAAVGLDGLPHVCRDLQRQPAEILFAFALGGGLRQQRPSADNVLIDLRQRGGEALRVSQRANQGEVTAGRQTQHRAAGQNELDPRRREHLDGKKPQAGRGGSIRRRRRRGGDPLALTEGGDGQARVLEAKQMLLPERVEGRQRRVDVLVRRSEPG